MVNGSEMGQSAKKTSGWAKKDSVKTGGAGTNN